MPICKKGDVSATDNEKKIFFFCMKPYRLHNEKLFHNMSTTCANDAVHESFDIEIQCTFALRQASTRREIRL